MRRESDIEQRSGQLDVSVVRRAVFAIVVVGIAIFGLTAVGRPSSPSLSSNSLKPIRSVSPHASQTSRPDTSRHSGVVGSDSTQSPPAAAPASPLTAACKLLTIGVARSVLGSGAAPDSSQSVDGAQTADIAVSMCVFVSVSETATLVLHTALTTLGASENAVVFGSDRPSGVTTVSGYGQAAYWNPDTNELNILDNNDWLALSRSHGSVAADSGDVIALARSMKAEL